MRTVVLYNRKTYLYVGTLKYGNILRNHAVQTGSFHWCEKFVLNTNYIYYSFGFVAYLVLRRMNKHFTKPKVLPRLYRLCFCTTQGFPFSIKWMTRFHNGFHICRTEASTLAVTDSLNEMLNIILHKLPLVV